MALDPAGRYAYVANAARQQHDRDPDHQRHARRGSRAKRGHRASARAGTSPPARSRTTSWPRRTARRVFVANSGQDTITVLDVAAAQAGGPHRPAQEPLQRAGPGRTFQPRGMAVTKNSKRLFVTRFLVVHAARAASRPTTTGARAPVCRLDIKTGSSEIADYKPAKLDQARRRRSPASRSTRTATASPTPTSAFPNQLQSIVIKGNNAYLPNIAASPTGPLRFNVDTHAFVNVIGGVNGGSASDQSAAKFAQPPPRRAQPRARQEEALLRERLGASASRQAATPTSSSAGSDLLVKTARRRLGQAQLHGRRRHDPLHRPERPGQPGDGRRRTRARTRRASWSTSRARAPTS